MQRPVSSDTAREDEQKQISFSHLSGSQQTLGRSNARSSDSVNGRECLASLPLLLIMQDFMGEDMTKSWIETVREQ